MAKAASTSKKKATDVGTSSKWLAALGELKTDDSLILKEDFITKTFATDSIVLDNVLRLRGIPYGGRVVHIHGREHGGKSTLAASIIKSYQRQTSMPGTIMDFERTLDHVYLRNLGLNTSREQLLLMRPDNLHTAIKDTVLLMEAGCKVFMFDSIPRMKSKVERKEIMSGKAMKTSVGRHARDMQEFFDILLPYAAEYDAVFLMINQVRARIDSSQEAALAAKYPSFTNLPYICPGGNSCRFIPSLTIEVNVAKAFRGAPADEWWLMEPEIKDRRDFVATKVKVRILKNKVNDGGYREFHVWLRPGRGLDDSISVRELAKKYDLIKRVGGAWQVGKDDDVIIRYGSKDEFIQHMILEPDLEATARLKVQVAEAIDNDTEGFAFAPSDAERFIAGDIEDEGMAAGDLLLDDDEAAVAFEPED
jgi:RecA/RadA recombinase